VFICFLNIFICLFIYALSQVNVNGVPFITNYLPKKYNSHNENWDCVFNKYGIVFFANTSGEIIEYDGKNWKKYSTENRSIIRSLDIDKNGIIYVGSEGDFGLLKPSKQGDLKYFSLTTLFNDSSIFKQIFFKVYVGKDGEVYYCSTKNIYIYKNGSIKRLALPPNSWKSFYLDENLYISNIDSGLLCLREDKFISVRELDFFKGKLIQLVDKLNENQLLIYTDEEFYIYDIKLKKINKPGKNILFWKYLKENFLYSFVSRNRYSICGTIYGGLVIMDNFSFDNYILNDSVGMSSSQISSVKISKIDGTIWATTLNGIAKIEFNNPFRYSFQGLKGNVYKILRYNGNLYVGTSNGLFFLKHEPLKTYFVSLGNFPVEGLEVIMINGKELLLISSIDSTFIYDGIKFKKINKGDEFIFETVLYSENYKKFFLGTYNGLYYSDINLKNIEKFDYIKERVNRIIEGKNGEIWVSTSSNGIYLLNGLENIIHFTTKDGLPLMNDLFLFKYNDTILVGSPRGLFYYDYDNNKFKKYYGLGNFLANDNARIIFCYNDLNNNLWFNVDNKLYLYKKTPKGLIIDSLSFRRIPASTIYCVFTEKNGITWIGTEEGLFSYNINLSIPNNKFYCLIRSIKLNKNDSVVFNGVYFNSTDNISYSENSFKEYIFEYKYNSLTFTLSAPYYHNEENIEYSYFLEGFSSNWSNWSKDNKIVFTNLPEGKYTLRIKARNIYLQESLQATFSFEILPPWYRTVYAYFFYIILLGASFVVSSKLYAKKLEADKRRLEKIVQERTAEIVRQKNEIEEKNKIIEQKNKDITDSINYAKRIQEAILPSKEYAKETGAELFIYYRPRDIISGDFYFIRNIKKLNVLIVAAVDCTGHGVPGALMSMLGMSLLSEIIAKSEIISTDMILNELRERVIKSLNPEGKQIETKDGMDMTIIAYFYKEKKLEFSGANNSIYLIRNNELTEYKGDKMPIGYHDLMNVPFSRIVIDIQNNDIIYMFSDGFADQFGGDKNKKYTYKRFKEFLIKIHNLSLEEQEKLIEQEAISWQRDQEQTDDQLIIGIRFNF